MIPSRLMRNRDGSLQEPWRPEETIAIAALRDHHGWTFAEIGGALGMTRANASKQYARWADWAKGQDRYKKTLSPSRYIPK